MSRLRATLVAIAATTGLTLAQEESALHRLFGGESANLAAEVANRSLPADERDRSLSALSHVNFEAALQIAPALLSEEDEGLRFRAAWILADGGKQQGIEVLRAMAADEDSGLILALDALGRLRDPGSRQLLRNLLELELSRTEKMAARPRVLGIIGALSDYANPGDAVLISRAVKTYSYLGPNSLDLEYLSRTGGRDALPVFEEAFRKGGMGWAVMAAGLGLARCGSEKGRAYVVERLSDPDGCRYSHGNLQDGMKDDPFGPRAMEYILTHLGVPADEIFVPQLLELVSDPRFVDLAKARAWSALARINSEKYRQQVLDLAWKNTVYDGAARLIVLNDEARARAKLDRTVTTSGGSSRKRVSNALTTALDAGPRERRRWRETRGYAF